MKKTVFFLGMVSVLVLSGCSSEVKDIEIGHAYKNNPALSLNVGSIEIIESFERTAERKSPYQDLLAQEVSQWANERFIPSGTQGNAVVKIVELSMTEKPSKIKGGVLASDKDEYEASLRIRVSINDAFGFEKSYVENAVKRGDFVPANASLVERENKIKALIDGVVTDLDRQLADNIKNNLGYNIAG
jgi:hypothetical protein